MLFASCDDGGGGGSIPSGSSYDFSDNFDSYSAANPWTPAGGWTSSSSNVWAIVAGSSGNGVESLNGNNLFLLSSYTGTDYTVSAKVRATSITHSYQFGICARYNGGAYYSAAIATMDSTHTYLLICKKNTSDGSLGNGGGVYLSTDISTSTYYTLTLTVTGSVNPELTATVTDGTNSRTITCTDDATYYGPVITSGYAAINTAGYQNVIFDDFTVTEL